MQAKLMTNQNTNFGKSYGNARYRTYVLLTLTSVYLINFLDRILISVIGRPIIDEFGLSNFQFGILTGFAFAMFYTTLGIPIARLSDQYSRVRIIGFCTILWSVATILCGFTVGFISLLLARMAVGIGEAGCAAPSNSLISDYYESSSRPLALGIFAGAIMFGTVLAQFTGGLILETFSWREAFVYIGAPGVIFGLVVLLTIKEIPRGYSDSPYSPAPVKATLNEAFSLVVRKKTFWHISFASSFATLAGYSLLSFQPLFIQYMHGLSPGQTAITVMAYLGIAGTIGTWTGGYLTQKLLRRTYLAPLIIPILGGILCVPLLLAGLSASSIKIMFWTFLLANFFQTMYLGPMYSLAQSVVPIRVRATSVGILLFIINLIGYGLGPPLIGAIADWFTNSAIMNSLPSQTINASCNFSDPMLSSELRDVCQNAKTHGMKMACTIAAMFFAVSACWYLVAGKDLKRDLA